MFFLFTGPPTILVKPQSQQVKAGGIASFYCTAEGAPPPQIHWRKNGKKISQSQSRYVVHQYENGALLRIEPVKPSRDNTNYECLAENGVGDAVSAEATLTGYENLSESNVAFDNSCLVLSGRREDDNDRKGFQGEHENGKDEKGWENASFYSPLHSRFKEFRF
ncbi:LAR phosphatase, partial [Pseudoatta argentina]